jgi:hypothetical protein
MTIFKSNTEVQTLENYRVALENLVNQTEIATVMAAFGYGAEKVAAGKQLHDTARAAFDNNAVEDVETNEAYDAFTQKYDELCAIYKMHRKKAKVVFRKSEVTLKNLGVTGIMPEVYVNLMEKMRTFYRLLDGNETLLQDLASLKLTQAEVTAALADIEAVETARAEYLREEGESQDATKSKDKALATLDDWMRDMYAVAKIAMEDNPQLLETLSVLVRS